MTHTEALQGLRDEHVQVLAMRQKTLDEAMHDWLTSTRRTRRLLHRTLLRSRRLRSNIK